MKRLGLLLLVLLVLASPASVLAKKRKAWTEKELEALERQWEDGDAEEDLDTPERKHRMEMEAAEKAKKEGLVTVYDIWKQTSVVRDRRCVTARGQWAHVRAGLAAYSVA